MSKKSRLEAIIKIAETSTLLASDGDEIRKKVWESGVYLGEDQHVYHIFFQPWRDDIRGHIAAKRSIGEYLRWVDGLFIPGEVPSETTGVHYRAARKLRELL